MKRPGGSQTQVKKKCSSCCCFNQVKVNCKPESSCSIFRPYWGSHSSRQNKCSRILCSSQTSRMSPWSLLPCWEAHCFSEHNPCDPAVQVLLSHGEGWGVAGVDRKSNVQHSSYSNVPCSCPQAATTKKCTSIHWPQTWSNPPYLLCFSGTLISLLWVHLI